MPSLFRNSFIVTIVRANRNLCPENHTIHIVSTHLKYRIHTRQFVQYTTLHVFEYEYCVISKYMRHKIKFISRSVKHELIENVMNIFGNYALHNYPGMYIIVAYLSYRWEILLQSTIHPSFSISPIAYSPRRIYAFLHMEKQMIDHLKIVEVIYYSNSVECNTYYINHQYYKPQIAKNLYLINSKPIEVKS